MAEYPLQYQYHDYANEEPLADDEGLSMLRSPQQQTSASVAVFPVHLHQMLEDLEREGLSYIASWQPHGRCFMVHNHDQFVNHILPMYFRQTKIASFQRQLNLYGFIRMSSCSPDKGCYYHELFLRGKGFLAHRIKRTKVKGTHKRKPGSPHSEPDFYNCVPPMPAAQEAPRADGGGTASARPLISQPASAGTLSHIDVLGYLASRHVPSHFASSQPHPDITPEEALRMLTNQRTLAQIMTVNPSTNQGTLAQITTVNPSVSMPKAVLPQQQLSLVAPLQPAPLDLLYRGSNAISGGFERQQRAQLQTYGLLSILAPTNSSTLPSSVDLRLELLRKICGRGGR